MPTTRKGLPFGKGFSGEFSQKGAVLRNGLGAVRGEKIRGKKMPVRQYLFSCIFFSHQIFLPGVRKTTITSQHQEMMNITQSIRNETITYSKRIGGKQACAYGLLQRGGARVPLQNKNGWVTFRDPPPTGSCQTKTGF